MCRGAKKRARPSSWPRGLVGRLPGVIAGVRDFVDKQKSALKPLLAEGEDFGDSLIGQGPAETGQVLVLGPDVPARAVHALGPHFKSGAGAADHLELTAPLPRPDRRGRWPGPAQLSGRRHPSERTQLLPRLPRIRVLVNEPMHASSGGRRCEFVFDQAR